VTAPHLVRWDRAKQQIPESKSGLYVFQHDELFSQTTFYNLPKTKAATPSGIFGNAAVANKEKGQHMIDKSVEVLCREIEKLKTVDADSYQEGWTAI
jgi:creatinine amidohydrolase/Fe(II)-dependent formamide hydrolase-like protein